MAISLKNKSRLLLTLGMIALITGCDDNGGQTNQTSWLDWIKQKDEPKMSLSVGSLPENYVHETQSGNYLAGQFAQYRQDWKTANVYMDKLIALDPSNIDLQQRSMILSMQSGDTARAIGLARKVLEKDNKNLLALLFVGVDDLATQNYAQATKTLEKMPGNGIADFIRPILLAWAQAPDKKPIDEESLIANGPLHAYHALLIADYRGSVKDPNKYLVNVLSGGGADKHVLEMMADAYSREGQSELANKIYDTMTAQSDEAMVSSRQKFLAEKRNKPELALSSKIQTPAQGAAEAFYNMARILYQEQSDDSALVFTRLAQYLDPAKEDAKMLLASMMIRAGRPEEAVALYEAIKPGTPGYPESQRSAAELLEQSGKVDQSIAFLEERYKTEKDVGYLIQIGDAYRRAERHQEAIKSYNRAFGVLNDKVSSDYWSLLYARGMSYERTGDFKKAEEDLQAALEFRPDHPYLLNYLGYSWADQGKKLDKALALIEKAAAIKPDDGFIVDSLGWVYYKMGKYDEAAVELEKAVELVPYDPTINDHLGDAYWQVGRKQEARFQWGRALNHTKVEADKAALELKISDGLKTETKTMREAKTHSSQAQPVKPQ